MLSSFKLPIVLLLAASVSAAPTPENTDAVSQNSACAPSSSIATFLGFAKQLQLLQTSVTADSNESTMRQITALQDLNSMSGLATRIAQLQRILDAISMDISTPSMLSYVQQVITSQILALQGFRAVLVAQVSDLQKSAAEITETTEKNAIMVQIDALRFGDGTNNADRSSDGNWEKRGAEKAGEIAGNKLDKKDWYNNRNNWGDRHGWGYHNNGNSWDRSGDRGWGSSHWNGHDGR
ncbi:hypothetical protein HK100_009520, partial [Physocladia obscura]